MAVAPEFDPFTLPLLEQSLQSSSGPQGTVVPVKHEFETRKAGETDLVVPVKGAVGRGAKPLLKIHLVAGPGVRT